MDVQAKLAAWNDTLALPLRLSSTQIAPPHVLTLHITYHYTVILFTRPFYHRTAHPTPFKPVQSCNAAALKVVELLGVIAIRLDRMLIK